MANETSTLLIDFARTAPDNFVKSLENTSVEEIGEILVQLPDNLVATVLARLPLSVSQKLIDAKSPKLLAWIAKGSLEDVKSVLVRMPQPQSRALAAKLNDGSRKLALQRFLTYPNHSLGRYVSNDLITVAANTPTLDVLEIIKTSTPGLPVVIIDANNHYVGLLDARRVLEGNADSPVSFFLNPVASLLAETPLVDAMEAEQWQRHSILVVVDHETNVLGVISREHLLQSLSITPKARSPLDSVLSVFQLYITVLLGLLESVFSIRTRS